MSRRFEATKPDKAPAVTMQVGEAPPVGICFAVSHDWAAIIASALNVREETAFNPGWPGTAINATEDHQS
ncbi:hypothetical protein [Jiella avicenniae]|uniref:Uncharacterized protein n=1 Tax=Jiella avicenniae TaxID=2907202 RepID=A0A9X1T3F5_9HYPH|nr:hypothetical protein [Jiella avicenniae]MCE7026394.1 hypothetical protein [Jiella avicenniae]